MYRAIIGNSKLDFNLQEKEVNYKIKNDRTAQIEGTTRTNQPS